MKRGLILFLVCAMALLTANFSALAEEPFPYTLDDLGLPHLNIQGDTVSYLTWDTQKTMDADPANLLMQELYGCKIKVVRTTYGEIAQKATTMVMSDNAPDMIKYRNKEFPAFIQKGIVAPVTEYLDFDQPIWAGVKTAADMYKYQDDYYLFPATKLFNNSVIYYWTSYFEDLGLETPLELYQRGEWTLETCHELMKELTSDDDRDGIVDIYGLAVNPANIYMSCGADYVTLDEETGLFSNNLRSPNLASLFNFIYDTSTAGDNTRLMTLESVTAFNAKSAVMLWDERWEMDLNYYDQIKSGEIGFAPGPIVDESAGRFAQGRIDHFWVGKGCSNPDGVAAYIACSRALEMNKDLAALLRERAGLPPKEWSEEEQQILDEMDDPNHFTILIGKAPGVANWGTISYGSSDMYSMAVQYENPWQTLVEKFYPILQEQIDIANSASGAP